MKWRFGIERILVAASLTMVALPGYADLKSAELRLACSKADSAACSQLVSVLRECCDAGSADDCYSLGSMYEEGQDVSQDYQKAAVSYQKACDGGNALSCSQLGLLYIKGQGGGQDYQKAVALNQKACDGGNSAGCQNLGVLYEKGLGVRQDYRKAAALYQKAATLYQKACDGGNREGCQNLSAIYEKGLGVRQDYRKAAAFHQKAVALYQKAFEKDVVLYQKACDDGNSEGCLNLGNLYEQVLDYRKAAALYQKACEGGNALGCINLGIHYEVGIDSHPSYSQAKEFFGKACDLGHQKGCRKYAELNTQEHRSEQEAKPSGAQAETPPVAPGPTAKPAEKVPTKPAAKPAEKTPGSVVKAKSERYVIQVGSKFKTARDAEPLRYQLNMVGLESSVVRKDSGFVVRTGPYSSIEQARNARRAIQAEHLNSEIIKLEVVPHPGDQSRAAVETVWSSGHGPAGYAQQVAAAVRSRISFATPSGVKRGQYKTIIEVRVAPSGQQVGEPKILKRSGLNAWDSAVLSAVLRTNQLPTPPAGNLPFILQLVFDPVVR